MVSEVMVTVESKEEINIHNSPPKKIELAGDKAPLQIKHHWKKETSRKKKLWIAG